MLRKYFPQISESTRSTFSTTKSQLLIVSSICCIFLISILSVDDTISCSKPSIATVHLKWNNIVFTAHTTLTNSTTPIEGITESGTYSYADFLALIKAEGIAVQSSTWKHTYYVWWNITITMNILFAVCIASCLTLAISAYVMYLHRDDAFVVGPETALFLVSALVLGATICDYWVNVWYEINNEAWSNNHDLSCPFEKPYVSCVVF